MGLYDEIISGVKTIVEKTEKKQTITGPLSPCFPSFLTNTYAVPAQNPENKPTSAGKDASPAVGCTTKTAPINANTTHIHSNFVGISFNIQTDMIMAKNGDILLRIFESERTR